MSASDTEGSATMAEPRPTANDTLRRKAAEIVVEDLVKRRLIDDAEASGSVDDAI